MFLLRLVGGSVQARGAAAASCAGWATSEWRSQLDAYLRRGLESGLTRAQIAEALTHLGFYVGWPKATRGAALTKTLGK